MPCGCRYEKVKELRLARAEAEEHVLEGRQHHELLRKESDLLAKKEKTLRNGLRDIEANIAAFQLEKQAKFNEVGAESVCCTGEHYPLPQFSTHTTHRSFSVFEHSRPAVLPAHPDSSDPLGSSWTLSFRYNCTRSSIWSTVVFQPV
jgi:hypothetical protein